MNIIYYLIQKIIIKDNKRTNIYIEDEVVIINSKYYFFELFDFSSIFAFIDKRLVIILSYDKKLIP
jgi:hypothetical protein